MKIFKSFFVITCIVALIACSSDDENESCTTSTWYQDLDGDGLGNPDVSLEACEQPNDFVSNNSDADDTDDGSSAATFDITSILSKFDGTGLSYQISGDNVIFTTQDLPNHTSPYWPTTNTLYEAYNGTNTSWNQNPNIIEAQNITITVPLHPAEATNHQATSLGAMGIAINGIVFYNQYAGPNEQALTTEINSFDQWLGHPTGQSAYHYHIDPTFLTDTYGSDAFLGLLADGFPVYGSLENGDTITNADLDDFHGHTSATADFPDGIYHYHITSEAPYINGNGFYGTAGNITN